jgi:hypothetical protein
LQLQKPKSGSVQYSASLPTMEQILLSLGLNVCTITVRGSAISLLLEFKTATDDDNFY